MSKHYRNFTQGKKCVICEKLIADENKSGYCLACRCSGVFPTKQEGICEHCGKSFKYYKSANRGRFCSRRCFGISKSNIDMLREVRKKAQNAARKIQDEEMLVFWEDLKLGKYSTLTEAMLASGLRAWNYGRLKRLVGADNFKKAMTQIKNRPHAWITGKAYLKGVRRERQAILELEKEGYFAFRVAGSKGLWDVCAINDKLFRLIQVKSTKESLNKDPLKLYHHAIENMRNSNIIGKQELWVWRDIIGWEKYLITPAAISRIE